MDRIQEASSIIIQLNKYFQNEIEDYELISMICEYFDKVKDIDLHPSDLKFLKYISNIAGIPHYYDLLFSAFNHNDKFDNYDLNTISSMIYESTLHIDNKIKIHKYQKEILNKFTDGKQNRFFLSATTSFGKTFLIYEIIKKMNYKNVALIFPTIALLSENLERIMVNESYSYFSNDFIVHTLSDGIDIGEKNIFIFTPERYLSFIDKHADIYMDFVFVDEIYKIDNEFMIDTINKENERDTAYRVALYNMLLKDSDMLLVGPYIEFPDNENNEVNQSFNIFLARNQFHILNYNKYEIVNKSINILSKNLNIVDKSLQIDLKGIENADQINKTVLAIRKINENCIIYTRGAGTAETTAKKLININNQFTLSPSLIELIEHLKISFHPEWVVITALENKVGIHHGLVPKYIQKEIINMFNNGDIDILVSTTTITEGVNTSAKNLLVLNHKKGNKNLKTFDAKNIAGRAGRFLYHYSGRVLILDKKFDEILKSKDDEIKHKNYDTTSNKDEIDYFITTEDFLNNEDRLKRESIQLEKEIRNIPDEIIKMYKVISYGDKIIVFDEIMKLSRESLDKIKKFILGISSRLLFDYEGFEEILKIVNPIVKNDELKRIIEIKVQGTNGESTLMTNLLYFYLKDGFMGSVNYKIKKQHKSADIAIQETSKLIYNTIKYQLAKYLGVFNIMYKFIESQKNKRNFDEIIGIDKLLAKLEYNALSDKGKIASDFGVPSKIIQYYDNEEKELKRNTIRMSFDKYEENAFKKIEAILSK